MNWASVGQQVASFAPMLGKILPIPFAGVAGDLIASAFGVKAEPSAVMAAIKADPEAGIKLAKIEADNRSLLQQQLLTAETSRIGEVNETMRSEGKSEHWAQWLWRPFNGFLFGITLFFVYALPAIVNTFAPLWFEPVAESVVINGIESTRLVAAWLPVEIENVPEFVFMAWGSVLGVAAWHRGKQKVEKEKRGLA